ncbi:hypothetical protein AS188_15845 (plasmid) [Kocuria flava]|uniref:Uncharacterized protein n=1 Tax=Kocuria flava TaxID=446860 RepID=A0A0U3GQA3_9MICC|nr:hypothetical protein [Kocuria flava]ALU41363.1 hypothetical protein AS188_15845 [Kocuria flava]GEO93667.1 hypothetical protein KFL01_29730 [Kocuria flava]
MSTWEEAQQLGIERMYFIELHRQARTCLTACDRTLELGEHLRAGLRPNHPELRELQERVDQAISAAASIRNLLFGSNARRKKPEDLYELGNARIEWLKGFVGEHEFPTIESVDARNSLEHFDERIDRMVYDSLSRPADERLPAVFDSVVKSRGAWGPDKRPYVEVRCYIADEANFVIWDDVVHIPDLRGEAQRIVRATKNHIPSLTQQWDTTGAPPQTLVIL